MADLKKTITVAVRLVPDLDPADRNANLCLAFQPPNKLQLSQNNANRTLEFDKVFDKNINNQTIYNEVVDSLVARSVTGFNTCMICYGSTKTGKAHTLFGSAADPQGVIAKSADGLFARLSNQKGLQYFITVSMFQIKNNVIIDLLNPNTKSTLQLLDHRALGCYVENLAEIECLTSDDLIEYVRQGARVYEALEQRTTSAGKADVFVDVSIEVTDAEQPLQVRSGRMRFVMISASGATSLKFNPGLQSFNRIVEGLAAEREQWELPFNSSKLTRLLEAALGGNCITFFSVHANPKARFVTDTANSLDIGDKLRKVKNLAKVNKNTVNATIVDLREEVKKIRARLNLNQPGQYMHDIDPNNLKVMKQLLTELEKAKKQTWDSRRKASSALLSSRMDNLKAEGLSFVTSPDITLPDSVSKTAKEMIRAIIKIRNRIEESEIQLQEKRKDFRLRLEALAQSAGDDNIDDRKLAEIDLQINQAEEQQKKLRMDLERIEEDYRKLMQQVVSSSSRARSMFIESKDAIYVESINQTKEWQQIKQEMAEDKELLLALSQHDLELGKAIQIMEAGYHSRDGIQAMKEQHIQALSALIEHKQALRKLEWERDAIWGRFLEYKYRVEAQMNQFQDHYFFIFRKYRSFFEEQKNRMEMRYRELLENSVRDALKLAEENQRLRQLLEEKSRLI